MFNAECGEAPVTIDGEAHRLRLTLGALAEIEHALGAAAPTGLAERMKALSAGDLKLLLCALLHAGGAHAAETLAARADPREAARAVAACLKANLS